MKVLDKQITSLIHQSNLIEGYDDERHDKTSLAAWRWLLGQPALALSNETICELQRLIVQPQTDLKPEWRGAFRKIPVYIGGKEAPKSTEIPRLMRMWLSTYAFTQPHTSHVQFEHIHPFVDGNGRTGRMLMWWLQYHRGEPLTEITYDNRQKYYKWFQGRDV